MPRHKRGVEPGRWGRWWHETFDDWFFRSMIGPAQTGNAVQGTDEAAREQWKRDLEARKQYSRELRDRKRGERQAADPG